MKRSLTPIEKTARAKAMTRFKRVLSLKTTIATRIQLWNVLYKNELAKAVADATR